MIGRWITIAAALAAAPAHGQTQETAATPAVGNLQGLISYEDYPQEALDRGDQGTVHVRLTIGTDGRVIRCEVSSSSGHESLDSRTCELLLERARFTPAKDERGRPTFGTFSQRISWRIQSMPIEVTRGQALLLLWTTCTMGETAKLSVTAVSPENVRDGAFAACADLERRMQTELALTPDSGGGLKLDDLRKSMGDKVIGAVREMRETLAGTPAGE